MSELSHFTAVEDREFANYRPTNVLAIVSLLIAFVSGVALIHPLLSLVAVAAALVAVAALLPSRADAWGRPFAIFALALSIFFVSFGNTWFFYRRTVVFAEARKNCEYWLGLMAHKDYRQAHQLSREHVDRVGPTTSLDDHYSGKAHTHDHDDHDNHEHDRLANQEGGGSSTPAEQLEAFLTKFPISRLVALGEFKWRYEMIDTYQKSPTGEEEIELRFWISPTAGGESFNLRVIAIRGVENKIAYWRIGNIAGERILQP